MGFCEKNYSVLSLLCDYDNLIVVRAFTKLFAIPGVRLGYMLSKNEAVRQKVQRNLPEWNVSVLAQMAGEAEEAGLTSDEAVMDLVKEVRAESEA